MRYDTVSMLSGALAFFVGREVFRGVSEYQKLKEMEKKVYKEREQQRASSKD